MVNKSLTVFPYIKSPLFKDLYADDDDGEDIAENDIEQQPDGSFKLELHVPK